MDERRQFTRIPFEVRAVLRDNGNEWPVELIDISLKGALVTRPEGWSAIPGRACAVHIELTDETLIHMEGTVAHLQPDRVGFRCDHMDVDSITHLRRLAELNLGDASLVERELSALGRLRQ